MHTTHDVTERYVGKKRIKKDNRMGVRLPWNEVHGKVKGKEEWLMPSDKILVQLLDPCVCQDDRNDRVFWNVIHFDPWYIHFDIVCKSKSRMIQFVTRKREREKGRLPPPPFNENLVQKAATLPNKTDDSIES
jgi:hypothetical protein